MAWMSPVLMSIPPWADEEEIKAIWENDRAIHNDFAEAFNKDWLNRLFGHKIELMPSFEEMMATSQSDTKPVKKGE